MAVITVSRQLGSQGEEVVTRVAQALRLRLVDAQAIHQAAQKAGIPDVALAELERETEHSLANQVLKALRTMPSLRSMPAWGAPPAGEESKAYADLPGLTIPFAGLFSPTARPISASLESHMRMLSLVVRGLAQEGQVLILGRGGQAILKDHPHALHVQVVAPVAYRVGVVSKRLGLSKRQAQNRVRLSDRARADYLRRYHDVDWLDPTLYHLVINTGRVSVATAADLVIAAARAVLGPPGEAEGDEQDDA